MQSTLSKDHLEPEVIDLGLINYQEALDYQLQALTTPDKIIVCTHPPVVTTGRATQAGDIFGWSGPIVEIQRGGRATYHGPNQIIVYPILKLDRFGRDLHKYLRHLESAVINTLKDFGISSEGRTHDATGVWVGDKKIASIGIGVKNWVSYHGLALNVDHDPKAFQGINPCGFSSDVMISMEQVLGHKMDRKSLTSKLVSYLWRS